MFFSALFFFVFEKWNLSMLQFHRFFDSPLIFIFFQWNICINWLLAPGDKNSANMKSGSGCIKNSACDSFFSIDILRWVLQAARAVPRSNRRTSVKDYRAWSQSHTCIFDFDITMTLPTGISNSPGWIHGCR